MYHDIIVLKTHDYADLVLNATPDCYLHSGLNFRFRTAHSHSNVTEKVPRWVRRDSSSSGREMIVQSAPGLQFGTHVNAKNPEKKRMLFNCFGNKLPTQVDKAIGREKLEFTELLSTRFCRDDGDQQRHCSRCSSWKPSMC